MWAWPPAPRWWGCWSSRFPTPDTDVFSVLTRVFLLLAVAIWLFPETVASPVGAPVSLRPRAGVSQDSRRRFLAAVPALVASWSVTGLFLALTPSVVTDVLHVTQGAAGGLDIAALFLAGGMGGRCSAHHTVRQATLLGAVLLTVGSARPCGGHGPAVPGRDWPATWSDRAGRDRTPTVPGHEVSGVVTELGYGTTGLTVGQRVFGLTDWTRDGSLAEYVAVEARNLAPLPADVDHTVAAALPICGLTA